MNRVNKRVSDMVSPLYHGLEDGVVYRFFVYEGNEIAGEDFDYEDDAIDFAQDLVDRGTDREVVVERRVYATPEDASKDYPVDYEDIWSSEDYKVSDSRVSDMTKPVHLRGYAKMRREERRAKNAELRNEDFDEKEKDDKQEEVNDSYRVEDAAADVQRAVDELHECRYEIGGVAKLLAPSAKRGGRGTISITTNADAVRNNAHVDIFKVESDPKVKERLEEFYSDYANTELKIVGVRCTYNGSYSESIANTTPNHNWGERNSYDMSSTYAPSEWVINLDVADNSITDSQKIKDEAINVDEFCSECVRIGNELGFESSKEWVTKDCCLLNYEFRLDEDNNDPNTPDWFTHLIQLKLRLVKYGRGRGVGYYVDLNGFIDFIDGRLDHFASNPKTQKFVSVFTPLADELKKLAQGVIDGSKVFDSKRIKDDDSTDDVIDGLLIITFKDGSQEDGLKAVQEHANEQGDGYETYEVKEQDGKVGVDMCAQTSDPNGFVKELLNAWGVLDAVADVDFKKSDLMEEAEQQQEEVSDSKKVEDASSLKMPKKWDRTTASINGVDYTISHEPTGFGGQQKRNGTFMLSSSDGYFQGDRFNYGDTYGGYISPRDAFQTLRGRIGERPLSDSRKIKDSAYGTRFRLEYPVNDFDAADEFLHSEDMTQYLIDDLDYLGLQHLNGKITLISWELANENEGVVFLKTTEPLAQEDLDKISDWVRGQNADGLGESFEQQDFAQCYADPEYEYDEDGQFDYYPSNEGEFLGMASFDWKTNPYTFKKVQDSRRLSDGSVKDSVDFVAMRRMVASTIHCLEMLGEPVTADSVADYLHINEYEADSAMLDRWYDIIEDEIANYGEPDAEDVWRNAEDNYLLGRRADSRIKDGCGEDAESVGKVNNTDILRDNKKGGVYVWVNGKKKKFSTKKDAEEYIKKTYNEDGTPKK